jgi:hypothetical protein
VARYPQPFGSDEVLWPFEGSPESRFLIPVPPLVVVSANEKLLAVSDSVVHR